MDFLLLKGLSRFFSERNRVSERHVFSLDVVLILVFYFMQGIPDTSINSPLGWIWWD